MVPNSIYSISYHPQCLVKNATNSKQVSIRKTSCTNIARRSLKTTHSLVTPARGFQSRCQPVVLRLQRGTRSSLAAAGRRIPLLKDAPNGVRLEHVYRGH
ncbi:hypothetical protein NX059_008122 [Plenodomus lindquistii]|nr:hypothetical protein NX059_008122 [Plenodomus lindquistii]